VEFREWNATRALEQGGTMYSLVMAALMLFPWLLTFHIALGSFRVARKELRRGRGAGWRGRLGIETGGASLDKPVPPGAGQVHSLAKISSRTDIRVAGI